MTNYNGYNKHQKLKSRKLLEQVFAKGKQINAFPIKIFYLPTQETAKSTIQAGIGTSSRNFKKATQRNRIKRVLREAFRLNKQSLLQQLSVQEKNIIVFFLYVDKEMPNYNIVVAKMQEGLQKLQKACE